MGRTIHYEVMNKDDITQEERQTIRRISDACVQGNLEKLWTCESFHFDEESLSGFCKVGDDEMNADLVLCALVAISKETEAVISIYDEGDFLRIPIILKTGRAKPWTDRCHERWQHWLDRQPFSALQVGRMLEEIKLMWHYDEGQGYTNPWNFVRLEKMTGPGLVTAE